MPSPIIPIEAFSNYCGDQIENILLPLHFFRIFCAYSRKCSPCQLSRFSSGSVRALMIGFLLARSSRVTRIVKLSGRSIMAKSFVYFSAGVSGESRPPLALARDDGRGLCRNVVARQYCL